MHKEASSVPVCLPEAPVCSTVGSSIMGLRVSSNDGVVVGSSDGAGLCANDGRDVGFSEGSGP